MKNIIKTLIVVMVVALALTVLVACDQPQQTTEPEGCQHTCVQEYLPGYDATCTEDGLRPGFKCPDCGEFTKEQVVVPARGHKMADATCTKAQTCTECGATEGEALGHSFTIEVEAKDAACEEIGYTAHKKCDVCDAPNEDYVEYEALEHDFTEDGYFYYPSAPTCEAGAYIVNVCTICEKMCAFGEEPELGHDVGEDGVCANCGNVLVETSEELIAALEAGKNVLLTSDLELDADVTINVAGESILNLAGHTITAVSDQTGSNRNVINVTGTLTVLNGTITLEHKGENMGWGSSTNVFNVTAGGVLNLKDATVKNLGGSDMAFVAHLNNWGEVTLNAENVTFESTYVAIRVFNSGNDMNNVTLTGCTVKGVSAAFWVHNYTVADFGTVEKAEAHKALLNLNIYDETNTFEYDGNRAGVIRLGMTNSVYTDAEGNHIHNFVDVTEKAATCTEAGYTAHKACDCGETEGKEEIITGHNFVDGTCTGCDLILNLFAGKQFVGTNDAAANIYSASFGYQTLTDGIIYEEAKGRFSSKMNGGKVEGVIDLGAVYDLDELKVYLYWDGGIQKLGTGLIIQVLFGGEWTTVVDCKTVEELQAYWVDNPDNVDKEWLIFDLGGVAARQVKFTIPGQTSAAWTTLYELECSAKVSDKVEPEPEEPVFVENVFAGKTFIPTDAAKASSLAASWWKGSGYEGLTDGIKNADNAPGRFSTVMATTGMMDATIDLGGTYELNSLKFYTYDPAAGTGAASLGANLLVQVYVNGEWKDVVICADNATIASYLVVNEGTYNDYLEFDLGGIIAEKVRFYISASASASGTTYEEIECNGYQK